MVPTEQNQQEEEAHQHMLACAAFWLLREQCSSTMPYDDVSAMESTNHGLKPQKAQA